MNQSENINVMPEMSEMFDQVMKHLMNAKKEMGSAVKKDSTNPFHKSRYASLGAHLDLCESILDKNGLLLLHTINGTCEKPFLIATICHPESGQWIKSYLPLPNPKNDSQGLGASITYMRRYSINSMLGLTAEDDDGEANSIRSSSKKDIEEPKKNEKPIVKVSSQQVSELTKIEVKLDENSKKKMRARLKASYKSEKFEDIPVEAFLTVYQAYGNALKLLEQNHLEAAHA